MHPNCCWKTFVHHVQLGGRSNIEFFYNFICFPAVWVCCSVWPARGGMVTPIILPEKINDQSDVIRVIFPALDHAFVSTIFRITATPALILPFKFYFFHAVMYDRVPPNCVDKIAKFQRFLYAKSCHILLDHSFDQFFQICHILPIHSRFGTIFCTQTGRYHWD